VKLGDLVKRKAWDDIEYNPHKASPVMGVIVSYEKNREIPGGADIDVAFPDGIHREYSHHLEIINESR
jgi:hypothetical protein